MGFSHFLLLSENFFYLCFYKLILSFLLGDLGPFACVSLLFFSSELAQPTTDQIHPLVPAVHVFKKTVKYLSTACTFTKDNTNRLCVITVF